MKRNFLILAALSMAIVVVRVWLADRPEPAVDDPAARQAVPAAEPRSERTVRLDVGLDAEHEAIWHHLDEGSGFIPLTFFYALADAETGKPFLEVLPRYGLVPDPENQYGLPIGMTAGRLWTAPTDSLLVGVNCAGCHSGQYTYQGTAMTIDGAPNMLDFEGLLAGLVDSIEKTAASPRALLAMISTMTTWERRLDDESTRFSTDPAAVELLQKAASADDGDPTSALRDHLADGLHAAYHADSEETAAGHLRSAAEALSALDHGAHGVAQEATESLGASLVKFQDDLAFLRRHAERLLVLHRAFQSETVGGPGRADSFGAIWDLLVQKDQLAPLDAPVSIPHLFGYETFEWIHWDGNSSTVMGRDYAQAIALGADWIPETNQTTVLPGGLIELELTAQKLVAPAWPEEILGPLDRQRIVRGEALYAEHCAECHTSDTLTPVDEIGTDPLRATNFAELKQDGKSYAELLIELGNALTSTSYAAHGIEPADLEPVERSADPTWRTTRAYHSRALAGVWASAPYLHNGSVPTLWHLLQPAAERPTQFQVGRELDPRHVGIDGEHQPDSAFLFRTAERGNANTGHEYGAELDDEQKWDLVEYLKTL